MNSPIIDSPHKRNELSPSKLALKFGLVKGLVIMLFSQMSFSMMGFLIKIVSNATTITSFELLYYRCFISVILNSIYGQITHDSPVDIPAKQYRSLIYRSLFGFLAVSLYFLSFFVLNLSLAVVLNSFSPILTSVVGYILLKETLTKYDIVGAIFAFVGVIMIIDPFNSYVQTYKWWAPLVPISCAISSAFAVTFVRSMSKECNNLIAPYYFSLVSGIISPAILFISNKYQFGIQIYNTRMIIMIISISLFGWLGQILQTIAIKYEKAGRVTVMNYTGVIFAFLIDILYFHIDYHYMEIIGSFLIAGVNLLIAILKAAEVIK